MAAAPQSQAGGTGWSPAPAVAGRARGAAPRWVSAAGTAAPAPGEEEDAGGARGGGTRAGMSLVTIHEGGWERGRGWSKKKEWNQGAWG